KRTGVTGWCGCGFAEWVSGDEIDWARIAQATGSSRLQRGIEQLRSNPRVYDSADASKQLNDSKQRQCQRNYIHPRLSRYEDVSDRTRNDNCRAYRQPLNPVADLFPCTFEFRFAKWFQNNHPAVQSLSYDTQVHAATLAKFGAFGCLCRASRAVHLVISPDGIRTTCSYQRGATGAQYSTKG